MRVIQCLKTAVSFTLFRFLIIYKLEIQVTLSWLKVQLLTQASWLKERKIKSL